MIRFLLTATKKSAYVGVCSGLGMVKLCPLQIMAAGQGSSVQHLPSPANYG